MTVTSRNQTNEYHHLAPLFRELADASASESRRAQVRDQLVTGHLPLAEHIARRFRNRGQSEDDLTQVATVGLINAVDRFDPERGTDFLAFAVPTITGEIRRYFRDATWAIRVPRRLKELNATLTNTAAVLGQELGRSPRPSELAAALSISIEEVYEGLQAGYAYRSESLDDNSDDDGSPAGGEVGMLDHDLDNVENREALYPALSQLPERQAAIVMMRFFGNMTQTQIAERIGVSQMHVSRLLADSMRILREELGPSEGTLS
ncbi:MAG TPA: SigB/SigF/SigG family RNA polymerase sigma factor [Pseudonocardiaceae bacterium]|jgi:RNA polymerase sigma-B factor|nr:SigB/SigF/SigG family RNA polymerase sigma factor [Pseudonocardiaceae bacterium]